MRGWSTCNSRHGVQEIAFLGNSCNSRPASWVGYQKVELGCVSESGLGIRKWHCGAKLTVAANLRQQADAAAKAACSMNGKKALGKRLEVRNKINSKVNHLPCQPVALCWDTVVCFQASF